MTKNPILSQITNNCLKDNIEKLLDAKSKISCLDGKIKFQKEEIDKTVDLINQFKECHQKQQSVLTKFEEDRLVLMEEYNGLLQNIGLEQLQQQITVDGSSIITDLDSSEDKLISTGPKSETISTPVVTKSGRSPPDLIQSAGTAADQALIDPINTTVNKLKRKNNQSKDDQKYPNSKKKKQTNIESITDHKKSEANIKNNCVFVKIESLPLDNVTKVARNSSIHRIDAQHFDNIYLSGSRGLLVRCERLRPSASTNARYLGHKDNMVKDFYVHAASKSVFSIGPDYVLVNKLIESPSTPGKRLALFTSHVSCSCVYKSKIYICLRTRQLFIVDMIQQTVLECPGGKLGSVDISSSSGSPTCNIVSIAVVKLDGNKLLLTADDKTNEVTSYSLNETCWLERGTSISVTGGVLRGLCIQSSSLLCYTTNFIYFLDKYLQRATILREVGNEILFVDADTVNTVLVLDKCNILHTYRVKKGLIKDGSSVETISVSAGTVTAMTYSPLHKKIYFACGNMLYSQNIKA